MRKLIALILVLTMAALLFTACSSEPSEDPTAATEPEQTEAPKPNDGLLRVGDSFPAVDNTARYTFLASGDFTDYPEYLAPDDGWKIIFVEFLLENTKTDSIVYAALPGFNMTCYADEQEVDLSYYDDSFYGGELLPGHAVRAHFYYEVPENAAQIRMEYVDDPMDEQAEPVKLLYEGDKFANYAPVLTVPCPNAVPMNQAAVINDVELTLLSMEPTTDASINVPEGSRLMAFTFAAANRGTDTVDLSGFNFAAYADGCLLNGICDAELTLAPDESGRLTLTYAIPQCTVTEISYYDIYDCYAAFRAE